MTAEILLWNDALWQTKASKLRRISPRFPLLIDLISCLLSRQPEHRPRTSGVALLDPIRASLLPPHKLPPPLQRTYSPTPLSASCRSRVCSHSQRTSTCSSAMQLLRRSVPYDHMACCVLIICDPAERCAAASWVSFIYGLGMRMWCDARHHISSLKFHQH